MPVDTNWTSPISATLDLAAGALVGETNWDALVSNTYRLGGTDGNLIPRVDAPATPVANTIYKESVPKVWLRMTTAAGVPSIADDLNVTSITDNAVGDFTINFATPFLNANFAAVAASTEAHSMVTVFAVGSVRVNFRDTAHALVDPASACVVCYGDQ